MDGVCWLPDTSVDPSSPVSQYLLGYHTAGIVPEPCAYPPPPPRTLVPLTCCPAFPKSGDPVGTPMVPGCPSTIVESSQGPKPRPSGAGRGRNADGRLPGMAYAIRGIHLPISWLPVFFSSDTMVLPAALVPAGCVQMSAMIRPMITAPIAVHRPTTPPVTCRSCRCCPSR